MSIYSGAEIPNNGLVCMLDAANIKSYNPAENLALYSQTFTNGVWGKFNCTATVSTVLYNNGTAATLIAENSAASVSHVLSQTLSSITGTYTVSGYFKAAGRTKAYIQLFSSGGNAVAFFDLTAGTIYSSLGTTSIENQGNGWFKVTASIAFTAAVPTIYFVLLDDSGNSTYTGNGTSGMFVYGIQVNTGPYVRPFTPTTASAIAASTTWTDLTGSGYNATLFDTYFVPTDSGGVFETRGISGSYILQSTLNLAATNNTIITATRYAAASPRGRMLNGRSNNWLLGNWNGTTENYYAEGWVSAIGAGTADTNWRIMAGTGQIAADAYSVYVNGTNTVLNSVSGSAGPNGFVVGTTGYSLGSELTLGRCSFVLAYNRVLTSLEISQVFQAYRGRFGI